MSKRFLIEQPRCPTNIEKNRKIFCLPKANKSFASVDKEARVWMGKGFLMKLHTVLHTKKKLNNISSSKEKGKEFFFF